MPNFKTGLPRQPDYDQDHAFLLGQIRRLESALSASNASRVTAGSTTTATTVINNTTVVSGGGASSTGFISLTGPSWLQAGPTVAVPPGGTLTLTDAGQSAFYLLGGPTAFGTTAAATFKHLSAYNGTVNVLHYGALGNGTTDDASAIQAALNTGKCVYFPPLTYAIGTALTIATGGTVVDAYGATLLKTKGIDGLTLNLSADRCYVAGLTVNGQGNSGAGVVVLSNRNQIRGVRSLMNNDGIVLFGQGTNPGADVDTVEGCEVSFNTASGLYLHNATDCFVSNLLSQANGVHGILIETTGYSCKIVNSLIDSNARRSGQAANNITVRQADALLIANSVITNCNNGGDGIRFDSGPVSEAGFGIVNCDIAANGAWAVRATAASGHVVNRARLIGNRINSNVSGSVLIDVGSSGWFLIGNDFNGTPASDFGTGTIIWANDTPTASVVTSLNNLAYGVTLAAGANMIISSAGQTITLAASLTAAGTGGSGSGASVSAGWWNVYGVLTPPQTADTTWLNQGQGSTAAILTPLLNEAGLTAGLHLLAPADGNAAAGALRMRLQAKPTSATWTATMAFEPLWRNAAFPEVGMMLANTAATVGNLFEAFHLIQNSATFQSEVVNYTAGATGIATFGSPAVPFSENYTLLNSLVFYRVRQTTGTLNFEISADNRNWMYMTGWTTGNYVTSVQQIGYFVNSRNTNRSAGMSIWHWRIDQQ